MNSSLLNSRRIVGVIALSLLAVAVFVLVRWTLFVHDETTLNPDDLMHAQSDQPAGAGHRRLNALQAVEIPISTQFQLKKIIPAASVEDSVVIIRDINAERDQQLHLGEQLANGGILREVFATSVILDHDGRLERVILKADGQQTKNKSSEEKKQEHVPEPSPAHNSDNKENQANQELPRAGLAPAVTTQARAMKDVAATKRDSIRDEQIANSAKLPGYHTEQRSRMIVPPAPDTSVLTTPERSVPKAQGNRLPTASYTPPQS